MELIKKNIHMENSKNGTSLQMNLEGDYNFSDKNPEASRIIQKNCNIKIEEIKEYEDFILCKGAVCYEILYLSENNDHPLCSVAGELPFEENIRTEKLGKNVKGRVQTEVENFTAKLMNGRKIHIQTLFDIKLELDELIEQELSVDISASNGIEIKKEEWEYAKILSSTKELLKVKEEFVLPEGYANIGKLIWKNVKIQDFEYTAMEGKIQFQGILNGFFMYETEDQSEGVQTFEMSKAVSGIMDCPECNENTQLWIKEYSRDLRVECRQDFDGEDRIFYVELGIFHFVKVYENCRELFIADAYKIGEKMDCELLEIPVAKILKTIKGQIKIEEEFSKSASILNILRTDVEIISASAEVINEEVQIKGYIHLNILCKSENEEEQYISIVKEIPFEAKEEREDIKGDEQLYISFSVQQLHSFIGSEQINFNGILQYKILVLQKNSKKIVNELKMIEEDKKQKKASIVVVFAKENETVWDLGKKYQVSLEGIQKLNDLKTEELKEGQRVMVCREKL